jgi:hypothetical protein
VIFTGPSLNRLQSDPLAMTAALREYGASIEHPDPAKVLSAALPCFDLRIRCQHAVPAASGEWGAAVHEVRIAEPGVRLTGAELMWELHIALHRSVDQSDHHFFEGWNCKQAAVASRRPRTVFCWAVDRRMSMARAWWRCDVRRNQSNEGRNQHGI